MDAPKAWLMWIDLMTASGLRSFTILPFTRLDMNGSTMAISLARFRSVTALAQHLKRGNGCRIGEIDPGEHLGAFKTAVDGALDVVTGHPVVHFEHGTGQPAAVHRGEHDLVLERAEHQEVLDDVRGGQQPVDAGP